MTRTVYYAASTLDGFLADEHDSLDWLLHQDIDPEGSGGNDAFMRSVGAIVMGRAIYMWLHDHLEADGDGWPYTVPAWVLSHAELPGIEGAGKPLLPRRLDLTLRTVARNRAFVCATYDVLGPMR